MVFVKIVDTIFSIFYVTVFSASFTTFSGFTNRSTAWSVTASFSHCANIR